MLTKAKWVKMSLLALTIISLLNAAAEPESDDATTISPQLSFTLFMLNLCSAVQVTFLPIVPFSLTRQHQAHCRANKSLCKLVKQG